MLGSFILGRAYGAPPHFCPIIPLRKKSKGLFSPKITKIILIIFTLPGIVKAKVGRGGKG